MKKIEKLLISLIVLSINHTYFKNKNGNQINQETIKSIWFFYSLFDYDLLSY